MAATYIFLVPLLLLCIVGSTLSHIETCPPPEDVFPCRCIFSKTTMPFIDVGCSGRGLGDLADFLVHVFSNLQGKKIKELQLDSWQGDEVPSDLFKGLSVQRLVFRFNDLKRLASTDEDLPFQGLEESLEELQIVNSIKGSNHMKRLNLSHLKHLKDLYIASNNIPEVSNDWFDKGPASLTSVNIVSSNIETIGDKAFQSLPNLEYLFLSKNNIAALRRSMLPIPGKNFKALIATKNRISTVPDDFFDDMPALKLLSLAENVISELPQKTWSSVWEQLEEVFLNDNPLDCDSNIEWSFNLIRPKNLEGTCAAPDSRKGQKLKDVIDENKKTGI